MHDLGRRRRLLSIALWTCIALTVVGMAALYPYGGPPTAAQQDFAAGAEERLPGQITDVLILPNQDTEFLLPGAVEIRAEVRLDNGREVVVTTVDETGGLTEGKSVWVSQISAPGTLEQYAIVDFQRGVPMAALVIVFALAVVGLGRWQGIRALVGLGISAVIVVAFLIPALLAGRNPIAVAVVSALAVMFTTLPLSHGWSGTTRAAAMGTVAALLLTLALAVVAVRVASLTGLSSEEVQFVRFATGTDLDVRGLLLAGIIVGTLGVLDDVTVAQASTVAALRRTDPTMDNRAVFAVAISVGRDHIAATVNTLFLAYAGAALPLLILFTVGGGPVGETLTSELVAQEIVRTVVGSIGLILAVPFTTAIAAWTVDGEDLGADGHGHTRVATGPEPGFEPVLADPVLPEPVLADNPNPSTRVVTETGNELEQTGDAPWEVHLRSRYGLPED